MKCGIAMLLSAAMVLSTLSVAAPLPVLGAPGVSDAVAADSFYTSFESTDPQIDVKPIDNAGVTGQGTVTININSVMPNLTYVSGPTSGFSAGEAPGNIVVDDQATKFCGTVTIPQSFVLDAGSAVSPGAYYIRGANDDTGYASRNLRDFDVSGSDSATGPWTTLDSETGIVWTSNYQQKVFLIKQPQQFRYYRLQVTRAGNSSTGGNSGNIMIQFSAFCLVGSYSVSGSDEITDYLYPQVMTGCGELWAGGSTKGWTGDRTLSINGTKTAVNARSYNSIYDNLNISVYDNTQLSYMIKPNQGLSYDFEYTSMYSAVDLVFSDGTRLSRLGALDQYGDVVSPLAQGGSRVMDTNQWTRINCDIGSVASGKTITQILVGYEKNGGTPGKPVTLNLDDIRISRVNPPAVKDLADYTNILRGTNSDSGFSRGLTGPMVSWPHGFNFWAPSTYTGGSMMYHYTSSTANFKNIRISHEPSYWIGERGSYMFSADSTTTSSDTAANGAISTAIQNRGSDFSHDNETAHAYYYGVTFNANDAKAPGVKVEVTPTDHAAVLRFTFPAGSGARNLTFDSTIDPGSTRTAFTFSADGMSFNTYSQTANNGSSGSNGMKRMWIYGEFSKPAVGMFLTDTNTRAMARFDAAPGNAPTVIEMKVATSFISADQAKRNLQLEIASADNFDSVCAAAKAEWNKQLSTVQVQGATNDQLVTLYSNLYRGFIYPNLLSENTGTAAAPVWQYASPYSGTVDAPVIKTGKLYYNNGFWDTYRTTWATYALLTPNQDTEMLNGLVQHYNDVGWVPRWIAPAGTNSMVGTSSDVIFGDAIMRGMSFDYANAYNSALKNAAVYVNNGSSPYAGRNMMDTSVYLGYTPSAANSGGDENLSWSLEGYINDFGISNFAKTLRDKETAGTAAWQKYNDEYLYYQNRARNYVNLYNPSVVPTSAYGWLRGKQSNGAWAQTDAQFNPIAWRYGYTEQNAWNYCVTVPQDGQGLANLLGGRDALSAKLDEIFNTQGDFGTAGYGGVIHEMIEAREGKQGQFGLNNQPSHHIPYMYLFAGQPWKTQAVVRDILNRLYTGQEIGQGYCGDEDNGEMSCWYVLSSLGLYPVSMGGGTLAVGAPLFKKAVITKDNGDVITINAPNNSKQNMYVQGVKFNGQPYDKTYFNQSDLKNGSVIDFDMGPQPSAWGSDPGALPPSITKDAYTPDVQKDLTSTSAAVVTDMPAPDSAAPALYASGATNPAYLINNTSGNNTTYTAPSADIVYYFAKPANVSMYTITSSSAANTYPTDWTLSGSNDGANWSQLDRRSGQVFDWVRYTRPFTFTNASKYKYYKLSVSNSAGNLQIAQLELLGSAYAFIDKSDLLAIINQAKAVDSALYGPETYQALAGAVDAGQAVYDDANAADRDIAAAIDKIQSALNGLIAIRPVWTPFDATTFNYYSQNNIKAETTSGVTGVLSGTVPNIGGTEPGAYVGFRYMDFGTGGNWYSRARATYAGVDADCPNAHIIAHLDTLGGPVIADIATPSTGSNWLNYQYGYGDVLLPGIKGVHTLYFEMQGTGKHVANINSFVFEYTAPPQWALMPAVTQDGGALIINTSVWNNTAADKSVSVIAAVYSAGGVLQKVSAYSTGVVPAGGSATIAPIALDLSGIPVGYSVRLYAWGADDYMPLVSPVIIK